MHFELSPKKILSRESSAYFSMTLTLLILGLACFTRFSALAETNNSLSLPRRILDNIDKKQTEWVREHAQNFKNEICGDTQSEVSREGFHIIKEKAERFTNKCYATDHLPRKAGLDFSSYQNLSEEIFFDSLIRTKLEHMTCREYAIDCLNEKKVSSEVATDFVDRLNAFRIYREKYRAIKVAKQQNVSLTESEKKLLNRYFPSATQNIGEFFDEWEPVAAMATLVNYIDPQYDRAFVFQEAFASLAEDEESLSEFSKMRRSEQIRSIQATIKNSSDNQKKAIADERDYWIRSCRSDSSDCFYRPTFEQKRKLVDEYIVNSAYDPAQWHLDPSKKTDTKKISKEEMAFACSLSLKYGEGAKIFDNQMNQINLLIALLPTARAFAGAMTAKALSKGLIKEFVDATPEAKKTFLTVKSGAQKTFQTVASTTNRASLATRAGLERTGQIALVSQALSFYEKCTSAKFKGKPKLPYLISTKKAQQKTRQQFLSDCRICKTPSTAKQIVDNSCLKETTTWLANKGLGLVKPLSTVTTVHRATNPVDDTALINEKIDQASDWLSLYLKNQALITNFDVPAISDFGDNGE